MGVGESAETAKKPPKKKFNFRLALVSRTSTMAPRHRKISLFVKII
jgi:hypothetical protein